jgi:uncharacterized protein YcfL
MNIKTYMLLIKERGGVMNIFKHIKAITLCVCLIILTACGSNIESGTNSGSIDDSVQSATSSAIQGEAIENAETTESSLDNSETVTVLAKSNNTVSDIEKQEVLDQLGAEMDVLLNTINEVESETIQDSELSF